MSENMTVVDESNFDTEVVQSTLPVLIDFWAPWCAPCMALTPVLEGMAPAYANRLKMVKINADGAKELVQRFGVRGIPHLIMIKAGEQAAVIKARNRTRLTLELDALLM